MRLLAAVLSAFMLPALAGGPSLAAPVGTGSGVSATACGGASDFTGDGVDDVVSGDPFADVDGQAGAGAVQVVSGRAVTPLRSPQPARGDGFGWSVAIAQLDGDGCADLVVGAPYADVDGRTDAGAVYILYGGAERNLRVVAPDPQQDAHFGWSVAQSAGSGGVMVVAVGAPHEDDDDIRDAGAVYLFPAENAGAITRISQESEGLIGNSETGDMFGWSLALGRMIGDVEGVDLAVGTPYENNDGTGRQNVQGMADTGGIIVVRDPMASTGGAYEGVKWEMKGVVEPVGGELPAKETPGDRYGYAMAFADGRLAVSAPLADVLGVKDAGLVALLRTDGRRFVKAGTVFQDADDIEGDAASGDGFGFSLAMGKAQGEPGVRLAVGVPFDSPNRQGAVQLVPLDTPADDKLLVAAEPADDQHFGWSVAFSGNRLVAGIPDGGPGGALGVLGRNDGAFTLIAPKPTSASGTTADVGTSLAG